MKTGVKLCANCVQICSKIAKIIPFFVGLLEGTVKSALESAVLRLWLHMTNEAAIFRDLHSKRLRKMAIKSKPDSYLKQSFLWCWQHEEREEKKQNVFQMDNLMLISCPQLFKSSRSFNFSSETRIFVETLDLKCPTEIPTAYCWLWECCKAFYGFIQWSSSLLDPRLHLIWQQLNGGIYKFSSLLAGLKT